MKKINERWVELDDKVAGNVNEPEFYPTKSTNFDIKKMVAKLNKLYMKKRKKK
jgi:hypothetical protein